jgi:predicted aldo/keto reductase-like oxidoreductase
MEYRELGKTGKLISTIGLGCEYLDGKPYETVKETIDTALAGGVNVLEIFMPGREVRENIARALGERRDEIMIHGHFGSTDINEQYDISRDIPMVKKYFEELIEIFGHVDFGMLFFVDSEEDYKDIFETEFIEYVKEQKEKGNIKHIGFSSHNPEIAMKVIETGLVEIMLFSINPAFDMLPSSEYIIDYSEKSIEPELFRGLDPKRAELYKLCSKKQIGITVMKPFGGGKLISHDHSPFSKPMTVGQCLHYCLTRPSVASVLPGCASGEEMKEVLKYFELSEEDKDYSHILSGVRNDFMGNCVYCGHCQPCQAGIDIVMVNKYLDIAKLDENNLPPSICSHLKSLNPPTEACLECGDCEDRCPFGVEIIENMKEANRLRENK